jgi:hypothetical protein
LSSRPARFGNQSLAGLVVWHASLTSDRAGQSTSSRISRVHRAGSGGEKDRFVFRNVDRPRADPSDHKEVSMALSTILLIVLILLLVGALPTWPHSRKWGYGPTGGLGLVLVIIIVLMLLGRI